MARRCTISCSSVIDDIDYTITHVVRGEDHVSNTAMHIQMFRALGATPPNFAHLPMISDPEGGKLSKRLGSMSVRDFRETEGLEPMAIVSLLARLGSADPIEPFTTMQAVIDAFDLTKFSKGAPKSRTCRGTSSASIQKILHNTRRSRTSTSASNTWASPADIEDETFWLSRPRPNLTKLTDIKEWHRVAHGPVEPVIEDADFIAQACRRLTPRPVDRRNVETMDRSGESRNRPQRQRPVHAPAQSVDRHGTRPPNWACCSR